MLLRAGSKVLVIAVPRSVHILPQNLDLPGAGFEEMAIVSPR